MLYRIQQWIIQDHNEVYITRMYYTVPQWVVVNYNSATIYFTGRQCTIQNYNIKLCTTQYYDILYSTTLYYMIPKYNQHSVLYFRIQYHDVLKSTII